MKTDLTEFIFNHKIQVKHKTDISQLSDSQIDLDDSFKDELIKQVSLFIASEYPEIDKHVTKSTVEYKKELYVFDCDAMNELLNILRGTHD